GVTTDGGAALAAAHRVIDGVHGDAAVVGTAAEPSRTTRLAEADVRVIGVRDLADRGAAIEVHLADFTARQAHLGVVAILGHELRGDAGGAHELAALALLDLDVVDRGAGRDVAQREAVAGLDVGVAARDQLRAYAQPVGGEDVALLAVDVVE